MNEPEFEKRGVIEPGKTFSAVSGEVSETVKKGEACKQDEDPADFEKLVNLMEP